MYTYTLVLYVHLHTCALCTLTHLCFTLTHLCFMYTYTLVLYVHLHTCALCTLTHLCFMYTYTLVLYVHLHTCALCTLTHLCFMYTYTLVLFQQSQCHQGFVDTVLACCICTDMASQLSSVTSEQDLATLPTPASPNPPTKSVSWASAPLFSSSGGLDQQEMASLKMALKETMTENLEYVIHTCPLIH